MKDFYQIDEIGKMEYLSNLHCFCSSEEFKIDGYTIFIGIDTTDEDEAKNLHPYVLSTLKKIRGLDVKAKHRLQKLYNVTDQEINGISLNHIDFQPNRDFNLLYDLPPGSPVEYLSVTFSTEEEIMDTGGGNY